MLKIKDGVSYQKLNAIGFRLDDFNDCYTYEIDCDVSISIFNNNKHIMTFIEEGYEYRELAYDGFTTIEELQIYCPELIGLVEKIEE